MAPHDVISCQRLNDSLPVLRTFTTLSCRHEEAISLTSDSHSSTGACKEMEKGGEAKTDETGEKMMDSNEDGSIG